MNEVTSKRLLRLVPALAWLLAVGLVGFLMHTHSEPPDPVAARTLDRNHPIAPGDLETTTISALTGKYLKKKVARGDKVTADMVSAKQLPPPITNAMAAVITISATLRLLDSIEPGNDARICLKTGQFGATTKVLAVDCDEKVCNVLVKVPKVTTQTVDPDLFADAWLIGGMHTCSTRPP
jgi:hypothetical protein